MDGSWHTRGRGSDQAHRTELPAHGGARRPGSHSRLPDVPVQPMVARTPSDSIHGGMAAAAAAPRSVVSGGPVPQRSVSLRPHTRLAVSSAPGVVAQCRPERLSSVLFRNRLYTRQISTQRRNAPHWSPLWQKPNTGPEQCQPRPPQVGAGIQRRLPQKCSRPN